MLRNSYTAWHFIGVHCFVVNLHLLELILLCNPKNDCIHLLLRRIRVCIYETYELTYTLPWSSCGTLAPLPSACASLQSVSAAPRLALDIWKAASIVWFYFARLLVPCTCPNFFANPSLIFRCSHSTRSIYLLFQFQCRLCFYSVLATWNPVGLVLFFLFCPRDSRPTPTFSTTPHCCWTAFCWTQKYPCQFENTGSTNCFTIYFLKIPCFGMSSNEKKCSSLWKLSCLLWMLPILFNLLWLSIKMEIF